MAGTEGVWESPWRGSAATWSAIPRRIRPSPGMPAPPRNRPEHGCAV